MTYPNNDGLAGQNLGALSSDTASGRSSKGKKEKKPTKRVVNRQIMFAALFAVLVAVIAMVMLKPKAPGPYVIEANRDIAALTPIDSTMVKAVSVSSDAVVADAIQGASAEAAMAAAETAFANKPRVKMPISANSQLTTSDFGADLSLDAPLTADERLLSISASVANGVAGQLTAGDTVDILGTVEDGASNQVTGLLASNVPLVSVTVDESVLKQAGSQQTKADSTTVVSDVIPANPIAPGLYVIRVPAAEARNISAVQAAGKLTLLYRNPDSADLEKGLVSGLDALCQVNADAPACSTIG